MCKVGRHDPDPVVATILTDIVKDFGDMIATKLEMKLDAAGASGDLEKTVSVIHVLLGKYEGKTLGNARAAAGQSDADFNNAAIASARALAGRDPIVGGGAGRERERGGDRDDYIPPVWTVGKHDLCDLCTRADRKHLRKHCPDSATPGVDPRRQAAKDKRDKERTEKKRKKGAARVASALVAVALPLDPADWSSDDSDSDSESEHSDCSEQSTYDDEQAVSVQAADIALASLYSEVDRGHRGAARVAHRPARQSSIVEQTNAQMAALHSLNTTTQNDLQSQDGRSEVPPVAWAVGAASKPAMLSPSTPVQPPSPSIASILADAADARRSYITPLPLRREDARRIISELDSTSPLSTLQSVARAAELVEVRLGCGPPSKGSTVNRTKAHVLADMRAAMGLDSSAIPMGIPMETGGGEESSSQPDETPAPSSLPPPPSLPPTPPVQAPPQLQLCSKGTCLLDKCTCEVLHFGLTGFTARGGAEIAGSQVVADLHGELATCHIVRLADGTTLRATCPEAGPTPSVTAPPPGSIYLGCDAAATRVWATMDGRVISTTAKSRAAAELAPPPPQPLAPNRWCKRYTALAFITHLLVLGVAVGWSAGRPSAGMGHIVGLPDAPHDAGMLARKALKLFTLPSTLHLAASIVSTVVSYIGYIIATTSYILWHILRLSVMLLYATLTSAPVQRCASCQSCIFMLATTTLRSTIHIIWTHGPGPALAALGYLVGGAISITSCAMTLCATIFATYAVSIAAPHATHALTCRLRRAWGRVSPLIPPGSPPPWDTSTIHMRRRDFIHRHNWESRFAGKRRTCHDHLSRSLASPMVAIHVGTPMDGGGMFGHRSTAAQLPCGHSLLPRNFTSPW